ncbi:hypothetical protein EUGRSUZ_D02614 [Eucalyptus grandis]|uniref:Uncharacterized protein n=2 Tax=Eucalyptus grandis TaxID=71139 RepID=A0ACC3L917_EUCGR|nr:hypothetical protein EUGRSUZ_D02614 [Eucalyptus grandis]
MVQYMRIPEAFHVDFIHEHKQNAFVAFPCCYSTLWSFLPLQNGDANQNGEAVEGRFYLSSAPFTSNRLINILIEDFCDY